MITYLKTILGLKIILGGGLLVAVIIAFTHSPAFADDKADMADFETQLRQLLSQKPEIVIEAIEAFQIQQQGLAQKQQAEALTSLSQIVRINPDIPALGPPAAEAKAILVEFFDYQCGYCKKMVPIMQNFIKKHPDVRIVFFEFPILGEISVIASRAALAATRQGLYVPFHMQLMAHQGALTQDVIFDTAKAVGLDVEKLKKDMKDKTVNQLIDANYNLATGLNIKGTPAFISGDKIVPGFAELDELESLIGG